MAPLKQKCAAFFSPSGCKYGQSCAFSHKGGNKSGKGAKNEDSTGEKKLRKWLQRLPGDDNDSRDEDPTECFRQAWILTQLDDVNIQQQVITGLATQGGLASIRSWTELLSDDLSDTWRVDLFKTMSLPLLRTLSHERVRQSFILSASTDTIGNFIFGEDGTRTLKIFAHLADVLRLLAHNSDFKDEEVFLNAISSGLAVMQRVFDLNQPVETSRIEKILMSIGQCLPENIVIGEARQDLAKIERRLGITASISSAQTIAGVNEDIDSAPTSDIEQDYPGELSMRGTRHDNDHADICLIKILPTSMEIQCIRQEYLPVIDSSRRHLTGVSYLLDRQFRLTREDNIGPLRDAVRAELQRLRSSQSPSNINAGQGPRTVVHHNVCLRRWEMDKRKGLRMVLDFDQPPNLRGRTTKQREDWWNSSKRLETDAFVCFVSTAGEAIFFNVSDPIPTRPVLKKSNRDVLNEEDKEDLDDFNQRLANMPSLSRDAKRACLMATLAQDSSDAIKWINHHLGEPNPGCQSLVEFPGVLLPSFEPTLKALQRMSQRLDMPFAEILAPTKGMGNTGLQRPLYARGKFTYTLNSLVGGKPLSWATNSPFEDFKMLNEHSTLDEAQQIATINALGQETALIQGPPGTGKSFIGGAVIKTLLENRKKAGLDLGPIVCVTETNHALDQLLEHLFDDGITRIVRMGSRSKSDIISKLNLRQAAMQVDQTKIENQMKFQLYRDTDDQFRDLRAIVSEMNQSASHRDLQVHLDKNYSSFYTHIYGMKDHEDSFKVHQKKKGKRADPLKSWVNEASAKLPNHDLQELKSGRIPFDAMSKDGRANLHEMWLDESSEHMDESLLRAIGAFKKTNEELSGYHREVDVRCLRQTNVIGVTTAGLARNLDMLERVGAKILVVEEAGEVLESHMLSALLPTVQHAILIGDHQQLRPQINTYEMQHDNPRGAKYSLDISLFERLIRQGLPLSTLTTQRRMHPSIAELVRTTLYTRLQDHSGVENYPPVDGMKKRLFWLNHAETEDNSHDATSLSKSNRFEVELVASLVTHLVSQGTFGAEDIAVLTPYLGQLQKLRRRLAASFATMVNEKDQDQLDLSGLNGEDEGPAAHKPTLPSAVRIATVDNFQGEEAKVVIVSLVRCNTERNCGFLKTSNRINVLLSRARHGMYIIGNTATSRPVPMWSQVIVILEKDGNIGDTLPLCCARHPETTIVVATPDDFARKSPEGGCALDCPSKLGCGHFCPKKCHSEVLHSAVQCAVSVTNFQLPCGHVRPSAQCYQAQDPSNIKCTKVVDHTVEGCRHNILIPCHAFPLAPNHRCTQCGSTAGGPGCQAGGRGMRATDLDGQLGQMRM